MQAVVSLGSADEQDPDHAPEVVSGYTVAAIRRRRRTTPAPRVDGPEDVSKLLRPLLRDADREHFYVVLLSTKNHVLAVELVSVGSLSASIVHPREVFKPAILVSAAAIVVSHNHPSNDVTPSPEDIEFTRRLAQAGELLGIRVLDHVIVCENSFVSLREAGHF
jgi:DNA repair protein RadC